MNKTSNNSAVSFHRICDDYHWGCQNLRHTRQEVHGGRWRHQTRHPVSHGPVVHLSAATRCKPPPSSCGCFYRVLMITWLSVFKSALCSVLVGGGEAEEPDSSPADQTVHRTPSSSRPLLSDSAQLQTEVGPEEGKTQTWRSVFPLSLVAAFWGVFVSSGVHIRRQDNGASPQCRRRLQQTEHADPR